MLLFESGHKGGFGHHDCIIFYDSYNHICVVIMKTKCSLAG